MVTVVGDVWHSIRGKIFSLVGGMVLLCTILMAVFGFYGNYSAVEQEVGIELIGCANVATLLIDWKDVEREKKIP